MQAFGKFSTNFDMDYLVEHYIYINEKDEERQDIKIELKDFESMLKNKRKTVAGTIFLYNPEMNPLGGYTIEKRLKEQRFEEYDQFVELALEAQSHILAQAIKEGYRGKLIEIKYLFNYNRANIEPTPILEEFDADLDKYNTNQLTRYDKQLNYQDYLNIRYSGKFIFFAWGHKFDKHHKFIHAYAKSIAAQAVKLGKEIVFMYDNNHDIQGAIENAYFLSPYAAGKAREIRANGVKKVFSTNLPTIQKLSV